MTKKGQKEVENGLKISGSIVLDKMPGETPLECLERFRGAQIAAGHLKFTDIPMTYAGRLDPLASGKLFVLWGDECKNKEKYLGLDKEYEVEVLFGVKTDTGDVLGLIEKVSDADPDFSKVMPLTKYAGKFEQKYPAYSSKTVDGKQLHALARTGDLPDEMPVKQVEIYSIEEIGRSTLSGKELAENSIVAISKVHGDFRQNEIIEGWQKFGNKYGQTSFSILKLNVSCSSGTYMRSLAERMGQDGQASALAFMIRRTKIAGF